MMIFKLSHDVRKNAFDRIMIEKDNEEYIDVDNSQQSDLDTAASGTTAESSHKSLTVKQLRFAEDEPQIIEYLPIGSKLKSEQKDALWWNLKDYEIFSETARYISKEVRKHPSMSSSLDVAYLQATSLSEEGESDEVLQNDLRRIAMDSGLLQWCAHGHSRRGLERSCSKSLFKRWEYTKRVRETIIAMSKLSYSQPSSSINDENLRQISEKESRLPRLFARLLGEADAVALTRSSSDIVMRRWSDVGSSLAVDDAEPVKGEVCVQDSIAQWKMLRSGSLPQEIFRRNLS